MPTLVYAVDRPELTPLVMPDRFRHEVAYFITVDGGAGPKLPPGEYRIRLEDAKRWLDDQVFELISPLDSERPAEIELTEEQETWLEWMVAQQVEHIRVES